ncbi:hypothetical protein D910_06944 [Dendroctonus ponderosae]|uniref:Methyltransferase domain-containing protein n=2 Tax=Dendroctonus ponderosae TaxID=77166 RepID=U4U6R2_DENPD|nr:hypothetical protein D910_06944 [Dendroctonus ponderosae]KAH1015162.1 hypothetical protein HUJ05_012931 [Dendroctonus ponderosae]
MVDYFTKNAFATHIPHQIRDESSNHGYQDTIRAIYAQQTEHLPALNMYIQKSRELTLKNTTVCMSLAQFRNKLNELGGQEASSLKLDIFMKSKKSHEVEILSGAVAAIRDLSRTSHLIDIGDGKGYLSSMLALHYQIPVLGVDASEINTNGAVDRANKLSKVWNGVVTNIKTRETSINCYKQITKFVDEKVDFPELISNIFLQKSDKIGLVGLHTCGNLTPTCLKIYNECDSIRTICNVGCCYHHLTEEFPKAPSNKIGFPLSAFLKNKECAIGRGARMVAAQSIERILDSKDQPNRSIFYRALFEIIKNQHSQAECLKEKQVGRFRKPIPLFLDYVQKASKRLEMPLEVSETYINALLAEFEHRSDEIDLFYLIRAMLAPVVESLIILDRVLFLLENEHYNSFIVQFFDPVLSPRCYGIVSIKT